MIKYDLFSLINMEHHIKKLKNKNHMIILIDAEKGFWQVQHTYMIKILFRMWAEKELPSI